MTEDIANPAGTVVLLDTAASVYLRSSCCHAPLITGYVFATDSYWHHCGGCLQAIAAAPREDCGPAVIACTG